MENNLEQKVENVSMNKSFFDKAKSHIKKNAAIYFAAATLAVGAAICGCGPEVEDCNPFQKPGYTQKDYEEDCNCDWTQNCKCSKPVDAPITECYCYCVGPRDKGI